MEGRLDKLFKEKLSEHKIVPTEDAWNQLNSQLAGRRNKIWMTRLAIAASIVLLVSVGIASYRQIDRIVPKQPVLSDSNPVEKTIEKPVEELSIENTNPVSSEKVEESKQIEESNDRRELNHSQSSLPQIASSKAITRDEPDVTTQNEQKELNKTIEEAKENEIEESTIEIPENTEEVILAQSSAIETLESESVHENEDQENLTQQAGEKTYPKVKIVYKADRNSDLLAENNKNLIDKGIKTITKFSDEHIITDQVKTKLRNTKDDLLALNFGKLLNKSNKEDIEN